MKATYKFAVEKSGHLGSILLSKAKEFCTGDSVSDKLGQAK